ncbi:TPA: hypothetical protein HA241_04010 [Candidatus Woesearchaeota archaeon]|nr:hypothetical protein [Candidatus Woesearchaeota archaeon]
MIPRKLLLTGLGAIVALACATSNPRKPSFEVTFPLSPDSEVGYRRECPQSPINFREIITFTDYQAEKTDVAVYDHYRGFSDVSGPIRFGFTMWSKMHEVLGDNYSQFMRGRDQFERECREYNTSLSQR